MANNSLSICLAKSCCNHNYLKHVCRKQPKVIHGRTFYFFWSFISDEANLYCNDVWIGSIRKESLIIFPTFVSVVQSESRLRDIISQFNLFPA